MARQSDDVTASPPHISDALQMDDRAADKEGGGFPAEIVKRSVGGVMLFLVGDGGMSRIACSVLGRK